MRLQPKVHFDSHALFARRLWSLIGAARVGNGHGIRADGGRSEGRVREDDRGCRDKKDSGDGSDNNSLRAFHIGMM